MKYDKPEVVVLASAVDAIQRSTVKQQLLVQETISPFGYATTAAYEADE